MKKPETTSVKPAAKAENPAKPAKTTAKPTAAKKPAPTRKPVKKAADPKPTATTAAPAKKPAKKAAATPKPAAPEISIPDRVGLTAGSIWHYLAEHGVSPVAKLIKELPEEEKIIQRSIGWLAQEDKIVIEVVNQAETITLKG